MLDSLLYLRHFGLGTYYVFSIYLNKSVRAVVRKNVLN